MPQSENMQAMERARTLVRRMIRALEILEAGKMSEDSLEYEHDLTQEEIDFFIGKFDQARDIVINKLESITLSVG